MSGDRFDVDRLMQDALGEVLAAGGMPPLQIKAWKVCEHRVQVLLDAKDWPDYARRLYDELRDAPQMLPLRGQWEVVMRERQMAAAMLTVDVGSQQLRVYMTHAEHYALFGEIATHDVVDFTLLVTSTSEFQPIVRTVHLGRCLDQVLHIGGDE